MANKTMREEFYSCHGVVADFIGTMRRIALHDAVITYNACRPHYSLGGLTSLQYTNNFLIRR